MANRHLSRSIAMQCLYNWDFNGKDDSAVEEIIKKNTKEFGPGMDDTGFVHSLVTNIIKNIDKIDPLIEKCAPEWPLDQVTIVDRNILRLGIYELLFGNYEEVLGAFTIDITPPVIVISSPADSSYTNRTSVAVAWSVDGVEQTTQLTEALPIDGENTITRSYTDLAGNSASASIMIHRDTIPPVVVITSPVDDSYTNQTSITVSWSADGIEQTTALTEELSA